MKRLCLLVGLFSIQLVASITRMDVNKKFGDQYNWEIDVWPMPQSVTSQTSQCKCFVFLCVFDSDWDWKILKRWNWMFIFFLKKKKKKKPKSNQVSLIEWVIYSSQVCFSNLRKTEKSLFLYFYFIFSFKNYFFVWDN